MKINTYHQLKHSNHSKNIYPLNSTESLLQYLTSFLVLDFHYSSPPLSVITELESNENDSAHFTSSFVVLDKEKNIIYIGDSQEYDKLFYYDDFVCDPDLSDLQMLQQKIMESFQLPKDNFIHIIKIWDQLLNLETNTIISFFPTYKFNP